MQLETLLERIERRPEWYIGNRNIYNLRHFSSGYLAAMKETDAAYQDWLLGDFAAFLARRYRDSRSFDWAALIAAHEPDGHTVDAFFRLLYTYYAANGYNGIENEKAPIMGAFSRFSIFRNIPRRRSPTT